MNVLAIETTGPKASVALLTDSSLKQVECPEQMNHLRFLMPMISQVLQESVRELPDIDVIAVSEGPGSFTGIRIGVSSVKALAQALDKPVVAVPTLRSFVYHDQTMKHLVLTAFDARRSQVYGSLNRWAESQAEALVPDGAYLASELTELVLAHLQENGAGLKQQGFDKIVLYGDGAGLMMAELVQPGRAERLTATGFVVETAAEAIRYQQAASVAGYARDILKEKPSIPFYEVKPVYLRKAEAERKLEEKLLEERS